MPQTRRPRSPRIDNLPSDAEIVRMVDGGMTYAQVGALYGLSGSIPRYRYLRATGQAPARRTRRAAARTARRFGVEIEFNGVGWQAARPIINAAGVSVAMNGARYEHRVRRQWKVVYDATVSGGGEAVSPPTPCDDNGIAEVQTVMRALRTAGASVDRRAGMHVHVGMDGLDGAAVVRVVESFIEAQRLIDCLVQPGRRSADRATFSGRPTSDWFSPGITGRTLAADTRTNWSGLSASDRYHGLRDYFGGYNSETRRYTTLNIAAFAKYGTLEFRQHGGTLNGTKAAAWIRFCVSFVDAAAAGAVDTTSVEALLASVQMHGPLTDADVAYLVNRAETLGPVAGVAVRSARAAA